MGESSPESVLALLNNNFLTWGLIACGIAQLSKVFIELAINKKWRPEVLIETGGMPSSHSALVTGIAACVGWQHGFSSSEFALAATFALVVMYDASGIRRAAGYTAERVNKIPERVWGEAPIKPLKESLGHTKLQVLIGSIFGPAIALPGFIFLGSPLHIVQQLGFITG